MTEPISQNNPCPEPVTCSIAVELANLRTENATLRGEICAELAALTQIVRELKTSSKEAFTRGEKRMDDQEDDTDILSGRVRKLEGKIWWASGAAAGASAAITGAITFMVTWMKLKIGGGHDG